MKYWIFILAIVVSACSTQEKSNENVTIVRNMVPITTDSSDAKYNFIRARYLLQNGFTGEQLNVHFKKSLESDPEFARMYNYLSIYGPTDSIKRQSHELAKNYMEGISKGEMMLIEAAEYRLTHPEDTLEEMLYEVGELHPEDNYLYQTIAYLLLDKNPPRAIQAAKRSIALDSSYGGGYMMLGYAYMKNKQYDKSEEMFDKYAEILGAYGIPYYSKAELYLELEKYEEAIELMEKAYELNSTMNWIPDQVADLRSKLDSLPEKK
jgi:tetratricopeptide (TPR) repeat protein